MMVNMSHCITNLILTDYLDSLLYVQLCMMIMNYEAVRL